MGTLVGVPMICFYLYSVVSCFAFLSVLPGTYAFYRFEYTAKTF